jgi:hypothetical protein
MNPEHIQEPRSVIFDYHYFDFQTEKHEVVTVECYINQFGGVEITDSGGLSNHPKWSDYKIEIEKEAIENL